MFTWRRAGGGEGYWLWKAPGAQQEVLFENQAFFSRFVQVLFCYEQFDELTLLHLREFDKKKLLSVETDIVVDHYKEEKFEESHSGMLWGIRRGLAEPPSL